MDSATLFKLINDLIVALSKLLWPIIVLVIVLVFRKDLSAFFKRLRKGKFFGQEMELDPEAIEFKEIVDMAKNEIPEPEILKEQYDKETRETDQSIKDVLEAAKVNPELGIIKLSSVLESEIRILAGSLGQLKQRKRLWATDLFRLLVEKRYLPEHTLKSLELFWNLRNRIVHGDSPKDDRTIINILDTGMVLLRTIRSIPHEINVVYHPGVDLFEDEECTKKIEGVKGVILETTSPGGTKVFFRIFPTTNPEYYEKSKRVTWEWNLTRVWEQAWYLDPDDNTKKIAWGSAGEFIGRHIDDI